MAVFEILCLANSKKHGGRCVAGLRTDGGGWVRPVAPSEDGTLHTYHYTLSDSSEARVLDVLRVEVARQAVRPHQPENWAVTGKPWELVARPAPDQTLALMRSHLEVGPVLFGNLDSKVPFEELVRTPARSSLSLIAPQDLKWRVAVNSNGERKVRARFKLGPAPYELPVTDPACLILLGELPVGTYPASAVDLPPDRLPLLVLSLGEPFEGHCYKLVAAVIPVLASWWSQTAPRPAAVHQTAGSHASPPSPSREPLVAEFAASRGTDLGTRLAAAFEDASAAGQTDDETVHLLREVMEQAFRERLDETAGD